LSANSPPPPPLTLLNIHLNNPAEPEAIWRKLGMQVRDESWMTYKNRRIERMATRRVNSIKSSASVKLLWNDGARPSVKSPDPVLSAPGEYNWMLRQRRLASLCGHHNSQL